MDDRPFKIKQPAGLDKYIIENLAVNTYFIFSEKSRKVRCTRCGQVQSMRKSEKYVHNEKVITPCCQTEAIMKNDRYGRKKLSEFARILWTSKNGRFTYAELDEFTIDFTGDKVTVKYWPSAQFKFGNSDAIFYKNSPPQAWRAGWEVRKNIYLPKPWKDIWSSTYSKYYFTYLYPVLKYGTDFKYIGDVSEYGLCNAEMPYFFIKYLYFFSKYPSVEMLEKAGFRDLIAVKILEVSRVKINWRGKNLKKILGINYREIRDLRKCQNQGEKLKKYKEFSSEVSDLKIEDLDSISNTFYIHFIDEIKKVADISQVVKYITKQRLNRIGNENITTRDYEDYIKDLETLNLPLSNKNLYPKNFMKEHNRLAAEVDTIKTLKDIESFSKNEEKITCMSSPYFGKELLIRPAATPAELTVESQSLGHCVRTYKEKVCEGRSAIMVIRKKESPDEPYYTLELSPQRKIVQCRGKFNCGMTDDVKLFVDEWHRWLTKEIKKGQAI